MIDERDPSKEAFEDIQADQKETGGDEPNFINEDITIEEPLTYSRDTELSKQDLEDMKDIFTQDDNEILDVPSMINKVHTEKIDKEKEESIFLTKDEILELDLSELHVKRVDQPNFLDHSELKNNEKVPYFINRKLEK